MKVSILAVATILSACLAFGIEHKGPALQDGTPPPPAPSARPYPNMDCIKATGTCVEGTDKCTQKRNNGFAPANPPPGAAWKAGDIPSCIGGN